MTLILAVACAEGLVLASDGQGTYDTSGFPVKAECKKLFRLTDNVAWGGSGNGALLQHLEIELARSFNRPDIFLKRNRQEIRQSLREFVCRTTIERLKNKTLSVGPPATIGALFVGIATDGPFILGFDDKLLDFEHIDIGYAATGSAEGISYAAMTAMRHFDVRNRSRREAKMLAYRVIDDAISVSAQGIGPPIQMIEIEESNAGNTQQTRIAELTPDELRMLDETVVSWKEVESEALSRAVGIGDQRGGQIVSPAEEQPGAPGDPSADTEPN